eukprot:TRINITY_DN2580_c0_g1_i5.p2 TRINITY_DN2580_c0_g1~~TRINITY_DN2580_c0_g1_i5.p2  ORF type:complete len:163 (-),score=15.28 TRINITY_DN2580_c0_g1_i5:92-517(-)
MSSRPPSRGQQPSPVPSFPANSPHVDDHEWQQTLDSYRRQDELLHDQNAEARSEAERARSLAEQARETALKARKEAVVQLKKDHELRLQAEQARDLAIQERDQTQKAVEWQKNLNNLAQTALKQVWWNSGQVSGLCRLMLY